jgi:DNA replication protein DnaC
MDTESAQPLASLVQASVTKLTPESAKASESEETPADRRRRADEEDKQRSLVQRRKYVLNALVDSVGERYARCALNNYECNHDEQRKVVDLIREYGREVTSRIDRGQNIIWLGPPGTGKDHLMFALSHQAIWAFRTLLWISGQELWLHLRATIGGNAHSPRYSRTDLYDGYFEASLGSSEMAVVNKLASVDVLCLSDPIRPGAAPLSDYQADTLLNIVDKRYRQQLPTWVTCNCATRKEMEDRIGGQVVDRLADGALVLACNWPSHRKKAEA